jgi:hypothetical protein
MPIVVVDYKWQNSQVRDAPDPHCGSSPKVVNEHQESRVVNFSCTSRCEGESLELLVLALFCNDEKTKIKYPIPLEYVQRAAKLCF